MSELKKEGFKGKLVSPELKKAKGYSLTDSDVVKLVDGKAKVVLYEDMKDYDTIDELLKPHGAVFILYQQQPNSGHWVALFKREDKHGNAEIEHFDSYGVFPDDELFFTEKRMRKRLHHDKPYLTELLYKAPRNYDLIYNEHPFQKYGKGINTCGRWAVHRLQHRDLSLKDYVKMFKDAGISINSAKTDDIVTQATT